ncbi:cytochrome C assembly protein [Paenibacillus psychroresistens]|uniref:Cytochrome C assembly protein n=1 Tax=Paenibacillus psychroresistens TaxID=1778678 RepID=A0A6B8RJ02_9BACL|nr:cytochrome c biogenesis protein CcsA [Paenibacillus psychroresistens]QGQ95366.1 cytochrome C assembly protein [Paenibacillus psychroresistens]
MVTQGWMFDAILYIYALSLLFYFSDFVGVNRNAKRMGTGLLIFVWVLQTFYLVANAIEQRGHFVFTLFEALLLFSWLMVTFSLILNRFFRIEPLVFFANVVGFAVLALHFFSHHIDSPDISQGEALNELLFIHATLAVCSYAAFSLAAIFSGMYLFLHRQLKEKHWSPAMKRMPSLEKIEIYTFYSILSGFPLLLLSLVLGVIWITLRGDSNLLFDPKVVLSTFILLIYTAYLFQRRFSQSSGTSLAWWNIGAFAFMIVNFLVINLLSGFHR